ncbi:hypothetical protein E3N88_40897 [Mikania micrantha]|uniref:Uncharacterized protein n=1 Tax=Mikania micrantha TaxID=192012 RepID=A0A5N6LNV2_9ASTR|nr:hypothetical protein E3N88_40897 [Mikania micrantha]
MLINFEIGFGVVKEGNQTKFCTSLLVNSHIEGDKGGHEGGWLASGNSVGDKGWFDHQRDGGRYNGGDR